MSRKTKPVLAIECSSPVERFFDDKRFAGNRFWVCSSPVERFPDKKEVQGSTPCIPTNDTPKMRLTDRNSISVIRKMHTARSRAHTKIKFLL